MLEIKKSITKEELADLPLTAFGGEIHCIDRHEDVFPAVEYLMQQDVIGFDSETKPAFKKGVFNNVCLLQLSTCEHAFLFRIHKTGLCNQLTSILSDPSITKVGVGIHDDIVGLKKLKNFNDAGFIELQNIAKEIGVENYSLKKLSGIVLGGRISKRQQVSNWEQENLTPAQKLYAATDAWAALAIFNELNACYNFI